MKWNPAVPIKASSSRAAPISRRLRKAFMSQSFVASREPDRSRILRHSPTFRKPLTATFAERGRKVRKDKTTIKQKGLPRIVEGLSDAIFLICHRRSGLRLLRRLRKLDPAVVTSVAKVNDHADNQPDDQTQPRVTGQTGHHQQGDQRTHDWHKRNQRRFKGPRQLW